LVEMLHQAHNNILVATKGSLTVADYLSQWLEDYGRPNLAPLTFKSYRMIVNRHLIPALGSVSLVKLTPAQVQAYYSQAIRNGLAPRTVLYHHRVLHEALKHAVKWELVGRNVTDATEPPRKGDFETVALNVAEGHQLLVAVKETRLYIPILLAISTGMRRGEVLGLHWREVDLTRQTLTVKYILITDGERLLFTPPKTKQSRRTIDITDTLTQALKKHKADQAKEKLALGKAYRNNDLVVCEPDGSPINPDTFSARYKKLLMTNRLPQVRFHDLRHSNATLLLEAGANPKAVSALLGHANIGVTMDTYGHATKAMRQETVNIMESILTQLLNGSGRK
jgi:integrase